MHMKDAQQTVQIAIGHSTHLPPSPSVPVTGDFGGRLCVWVFYEFALGIGGDAVGGAGVLFCVFWMESVDVHTRLTETRCDV